MGISRAGPEQGQGDEEAQQEAPEEGVMAGGDGGEGKKLQHRVGKKKGGPPPGPQAEPTILREGEADILLHGNDVFYNKAQVMSICF